MMTNAPVSHSRRLILFALSFVCAFGAIHDAWGGKVRLWIAATNPSSNKTQTVEIRSALPARVGTNDIINTDGLERGYDVKSDTYYVYGEVELGPEQTREFEVEINDVWVIPEAEMKKYERRVKYLIEKLNETPHAEIAEETAAEVAGKLQTVRMRQIDNAIKADNAVQHIRAYDLNARDVERVRKDIGHLENLVLGLGLDLEGGIVGIDEVASPPQRDIEMAAEDYGEAVISITVRNTSPDETRVVQVRRELPPEIKVYDVLDSAGMEVSKDPVSGLTYVHKRDLSMEPESERTFNVTIRDKWNINGPRIEILRNRATELLTFVTARGKYKAVEATISDLVGEIDAVQEGKGPETLDRAYVAFYREQARKLDLIEQKINRIKSVLRPMPKNPKYGFKVKAPSMKTTWIIIYIVLGFLAFLSLLFFFRWFGRSKPEKLEEGAADQTAASE